MSSGPQSGRQGDRVAETQANYDTAKAPAGTGTPRLSLDEISQIAARLRLTPSERLRYLEDMIAFEEEARRARRVT